MARPLTLGPVLLTAGCSEDWSRGQAGVEKTRMAGEEKPWWHDMYEEEKVKSRERTATLIQGSKTYHRPPADPHIHLSSYNNNIKLIDTKTGDYIVVYNADRERLLFDLAYMTRDDIFVCGFKTQMSAGFGMDWQSYPIRVYGIVEAEQQTDTIRSSRKRVSLHRLAEFMTKFPTFVDNPDLDFVLFDAPREPGERL
jgi:hypothetical protein